MHRHSTIHEDETCTRSFDTKVTNEDPTGWYTVTNTETPTEHYLRHIRNWVAFLGVVTAGGVATYIIGLIVAAHAAAQSAGY